MPALQRGRASLPSPPDPPVPRYGESSLADLMPSLLSALGMPGLANVLEVQPLEGLCVVVIDGLGWELLRRFGDQAPFLASLADAGRPLTAGFPSTTSASLASLGTGLAPAGHGLVGYTFAVPGHERPMNALKWELYGVGEHVDLTERFPPELIQPHPTLLERCREAGLPVTVIGPPEHERSALTRAILRGGRYEAAHSLDELADATSSALRRGADTAAGAPGVGVARGRWAVHAYHPFLDTIGHLKGVGSQEWLAYLGDVDRAIQAMSDRLPPGSALVVTGDHGMVNLSDQERLDVADHPELMAGVRFLAGEARARHVHVRAGAGADVLAIWRDTLGDRMWVLPRDEVIAAGWFGAGAEGEVLDRIGDVVAAAFGPVGVFQRDVDPLQAMLTGHHGSLTAAEQLVPFLMLRR